MEVGVLCAQKRGVARASFLERRVAIQVTRLVVVNAIQLGVIEEARARYARAFGEILVLAAGPEPLVEQSDPLQVDAWKGQVARRRPGHLEDVGCDRPRRAASLEGSLEIGQ